MKLSFTIRHWPRLDWARFCQAAVDAGLQGLEIDTVKNPLLTVRSSPTNPELAVAARRELAGQDLTVPCVGVEADLMEEGAAQEAAQAMETARNLLVPYVTLRTVCADREAVA